MKSKKNISIFLVEDDPVYASTLKYDLSSDHTYKIKVFSSGEECVKKLYLNPDIILLDYYLNGKLNGIDVLRKIQRFGENIQVIFLSGQEKIEVAANVMKHGAYDYVVKNETAFIRVKGLIKKILNYNKLVKENRDFKKFQAFVLFVLLIGIVSVVAINYMNPGLF